MSNKRKVALWVGVLGLLWLAACRPGGLYPSAGELFVEQSSALGLYVDGRQTLVFNETIHQIAQRSTAFRIQTDDQLEFVNLQLDGVLLVDQPKIQGTLTGQGIKGLEDKSYEFEQLARRDGKIWLWNPESNIGVIIPIL